MPAHSPMRQPLDVVLHIGMDKTGTTTIQSFLRENRTRLADLGVLYPRAAEPRRYVRASLLFRSDEGVVRSPSWRDHHALQFSSPAAFRESLHDGLLQEIGETGATRFLLSDEAFYDAPGQLLRRLDHFLGEHAGSRWVVVYLRRQDDHLVSRYHQMVRFRNETRRLTERVHQPKLSGTYDYRAWLRRWELRIAPQRFVVRRFERSRFTGGSLVQDFLDSVGVPARAEDMAEVANANETGLDAESVEFLRILNVLRRDEPHLTAAVGENRRYVTRLAEASTGPALVLPRREREEFMMRWEESNRSVARDFLHEDGDHLFAPSRSADGKTSVQHLDPARLDHFLELLAIPEEVHEPLRRVAEREATSDASDDPVSVNSNT